MNNNRRTLIVLATLALAGVAFEIFNFDTTRFALASLFGSTAYIGRLSWAMVLAVAFCSIDCAGLVQLVATTPMTEPEKRAGHLLFGAWLLGATLNAVLTWYAIGVTMVAHPVDSQFVTHAQLIRWVPVVVATLVWLTRILFIWGVSLVADELAELLLPVSAEADWPERSQPRERAYLREVQPLSAEYGANEVSA